MGNWTQITRHLSRFQSSYTSGQVNLITWVKWVWRGFPFVDYKSHGHAVWFLENELGSCFTFWHNHDLDCGYRVSILLAGVWPWLCAAPLSLSSRLSRPALAWPTAPTLCLFQPSWTFSSSSLPPAPHQLFLPYPLHHQQHEEAGA